jgi:hypothetical protein
MFPVTIQGLDAAIGALRRPLSGQMDGKRATQVTSEVMGDP